MRNKKYMLLALACSALLVALVLGGCGQGNISSSSSKLGSGTEIVNATGQKPSGSSTSTSASSIASTQANAEQLRAAINLSEDYRASFVHGDKGAQFQQYIVLHDTESSASASNVIDGWDSSGNYVAAHFVVNRDGSVVQCVPLDKIAHHAGYGDTGHNEQYGTVDESRDDKVGTKPIGDWASDYGMNSYSVGIEMVHEGGGDDYTEAQLEAVDKLVAYIDAFFGTKSTIIDHKMWRSGNSDTSPEFAGYLANYRDHGTHN